MIKQILKIAMIQGVVFLLIACSGGSSGSSGPENQGSPNNQKSENPKTDDKKSDDKKPDAPKADDKKSEDKQESSTPKAWYTVQKFQLNAGKPNYGYGCTITPDDRIFINSAQSTDNWITQSSSDNGATWQISEVFGTNADTVATGLFSDQNGNVFVTGRTSGNRKTTLLTRRLNLGSSLWSTVDYFEPQSKSAGAFGGTAALNGKLFTIGMTYTIDWRDQQGLLRSSEDGGNSWKTEENFQTGFERFNPNSIYADKNGNIFVAAQTLERTRWIIRKSSDSGKTWTTVDDYVYPSNLATYPIAIAGDSKGNLYVAGIATTTLESAAGRQRWLVRKSTDNGRTWSVSDEYATAGDSLAFGVAIASDGKVFVAGNASDRTTKIWTVRVYDPSTGKWRTEDTFALASGQNSDAHQVCIDSKGRVYVVGSSDVSGSQSSNVVVRQYR